MRVSVVAALAGVLSFTNAIDLDLNSTDSILNASHIVVDRILDFYPAFPGSVPGLLPQPYYWWNSGLALTSLLNYWAASGNETIAPFIRASLLHQASPTEDFMPANQTKSEGNDDQAFWGLAAMTAAELGFPMSADNTTATTSWLDLAQNVFEAQAARYDTSTCGGGLRW